MHHAKTLARILFLGSCVIAFAGSRAEPEQTAVQVPQWPGFGTMHQFYVEAFVNGDKFGLSRVIQPDFPLFKTIEVDGRTYRVRTFQLVGLLEEPRPRVYRTAGTPIKSDLRVEREVRRLDEFEKDALAALRSGKSIVFQKQRRAVRALGAIRAQPECLQCHDGEVGLLLGAFTYRLDSAETDTRALPVMVGGG